MIPLIVDCRIMLPGLKIPPRPAEISAFSSVYDPLADLEQAGAVYSVTRDRVLKMGRSDDPAEYPLEGADGVLAELIFAVEGVRELEHCIPGQEPWAADYMQEDWGFLDAATMRALYDDAAGRLPAAKLDRKPELAGDAATLAELLVRADTSRQETEKLRRLAAECQDYAVAILTLWSVETSQGREDLYAEIDGFNYEGLAEVVIARHESNE